MNVRIAVYPFYSRVLKEITEVIVRVSLQQLEGIRNHYWPQIVFCKVYGKDGMDVPF